MQTRKKYFLLIALFYTLYIIFPLFGDLANIPVWLPSILSSILVISLYPSAIKNKAFYWFCIYALVLTVFLFVGKPLTIGIGTVADNKKIFIEFSYILPVLSIFSVFFYLKDYELTKKYVVWSTIFLYASFIVAVPLMIKYNSLREALGEQSQSLSIPGLPTYSLMHAYTLFLAPVCYAVKSFHGYRRIMSIAALIVLCIVIYSTFVTTSLIMMLVILLVVLTYNGKVNSMFFYLFLAAILFFLYEEGFFVKLIDSIYPLFEDTAVEGKLNDFRASMVGGEIVGDNITTRSNLHTISWNSFITNPLWGTSVVGGHSSILDRFGGMGILGGLPYMMIFVSFYKMVRKMLQGTSTTPVFFISFLSGMVFLYEKGIWDGGSWQMFMVMMPMALLICGKSRVRFIANRIGGEG